MKIYKYTLDVIDRQTITMSETAKIIHVNEQNGNICLWAEVVPDDDGDRTFRVVGTGHDIPSDCTYIGTCHISPFVWHIYEEWV